MLPAGPCNLVSNNDRSGSGVERVSSLQGGTAPQPPSSSLPVLQQQGGQAWQHRMTHMCDNYATFQFLFDDQGVLLAANRRAMDNMRGTAESALYVCLILTILHSI